MIKQVMSEADLAPLAVMGVVLFVAIFTAIVAWTLTRSRRDVAAWSSLPLAEGTEPVQQRSRTTPTMGLPVVRKSGGCGKCENCDCA